jgi:hypothetical protein
MKNTNLVEQYAKKLVIIMIGHQQSNVIMIHAMKDAIVKKVMYSIIRVIVLNQENVQVRFSII